MTPEMEALSLLHRHHGDKEAAEKAAIEILDDVSYNCDFEEMAFWEEVVDHFYYMEDE